MLYLFEYDTLFLLPEAKKKVNYRFKFPMYNPEASTVFLLHYKTVSPNWMPPAHQEQFEKIITGGFKYTLDKVLACNAQEIIHNTETELNTKPKIIFYMDNKLPDTVEEWLQKQETQIRYIPSLAQMLTDENAKRQAWKEIQEYLTTISKS